MNVSKSKEFAKKEIIAGLFVLLSLGILIAFVFIVRGYRPYTGEKVYYAKFKNTLGLDKGADVRYGGLKVGKVVDIFQDKEDPTLVCVKIAVSKDVQLNQKCVASVEQVSLTSARHLEISTGELDAPKIPENSYIPSINKSGALVELPDFSSTVAKVEQLIEDLRDFLGMEVVRAEEKNGKTFPRVAQLTEDIKRTMEKGSEFIGELNDLLKEQKPQINEVVVELNQIEKELKKVLERANTILTESREPLKETLVNVKELALRLQKVVEQGSNSLEVILKNLEKLTTNIDSLSGEAKIWFSKNRRTIEDIVVDLKDTIRNLRILSQILAEQPQSLLTGKPISGSGRK
ncbi:MAG: MlaD family protein [Candidatus Hydrogenedentes bacterium]|nr:MlaD family protein [Candidatus Hydrogenedentota bacterium]